MIFLVVLNSLDDKRIVGFFSNEDPYSIVLNNYGNIHAAHFKYAIIEDLDSNSFDRISIEYFEWTDKYQLCDCPEQFKNINRIAF